MHPTPARLLKLLALLQMPREWPGSELAGRLEVSRRTIRRDVERLRDLGYPVEATMGADGGYRLVAGSAMPPLLLDDDEAVAIGIGLRTATHAVAGIEEASQRALAKLEQVLPSRLRYRVGALRTSTTAYAWEHPTVDPQTLTVLAGTIANREAVRFGYPSADGRSRKRIVEPKGIAAVGRRWYLVAFDPSRNDWRYFRVDRIREPEPTGLAIVPRDLPEQDAATFVASKLLERAPTYEAVVTLHLPLDEAARRLGNAALELEPLDGNRCRLRSAADTLEWLVFRLALLECEFEVHDPPELAEYVRTLGARLTRGVQGLAPGEQAAACDN